MALTKRTVLDVLTIKEDGVLELRTKIIIDDDSDLTTNFFVYKRQVFVPGDDISAQPLKLRQVANLIWTPAVIAAYLAAHPKEP